jgi:hypothetical protein
MVTNNKVSEKVLHTELSYQITGILFDVHNELGPYAIEKQLRISTREHYRQIQNYLQQTKLDLGLLVNFRSKYIKPSRIIRIHS